MELSEMIFILSVRLLLNRRIIIYYVRQIFLLLKFEGCKTVVRIWNT